MSNISVSYRNYRLKAKSVTIIVSCMVGLVGCGTTSSKKPRRTLIEDSGAVEIQLKGSVGSELQTRFYSHSLSKNFHQSQIVKKKDEIVEFTLVEKVAAFDSKYNRITLMATSKDKDGVVDLHELAFPAVGEEIEYVYTTQGKVMKAGEYPKWSVFYVPPMPLPKHPVEVGDTWDLSAKWRSMQNGMPLQVNLVAILKAIYQCGKDRCADIELSGDVAIDRISGVEMNFVSEMSGRVVFNIDKGAAVLSYIQTQEDLVLENERTVVLSCMSSQLLKPKSMQWNSDKAFCEPTGKSVTSLP